MAFPPPQRFVPPGFFSSEKMVSPQEELEKLTIQDLLDEKVISRKMVPEIEARMEEAGVGAWVAMCDLGFKRATITDAEIRAQVRVLLVQRPNLDHDALLREAIKLYRGTVRPDDIAKDLP